MAITDWKDWVPQERAVLVFLQDEEKMLLIHKKRGLGRGKINAPGGRLEPGETWKDAAYRETKEETGLTVSDLTPSAHLKFQFTNGYSLSARVFLATGWTGALTPCDEADPFWHPANELPWPRMWADDALWLPQVLSGRWVEAQFLFDNEEMREAQIQVSTRPSGPIDG